MELSGYSTPWNSRLIYNCDRPIDKLNRNKRQQGVSISEISRTLPSRQWLQGVYLCALATTTVLVANVVLFIAASVLAYRDDHDHGFSTETIFTGSCDVTKRWDSGLHLAINLLSTVLLAASNYCMQSLAAPTRDDVDRFHSRRVWLDIGVPSIRNLFKIGGRQPLIWLLLLLTSTPIHLMYVYDKRSRDEDDADRMQI